MADGKTNPLYDVPRKPEIVPRSRGPGQGSTSESTANEKPLKPLVPPKRRSTMAGASPSSKSATPSTTAPPSTTTTSVAEARQKLEQEMKATAQPQKEPPVVGPKSPGPNKVDSSMIPSKHIPHKPAPSIPQAPKPSIPPPIINSAQKNTSSRYVEVGKSKPPVDKPLAPDYDVPDACMSRSSTSNYSKPVNTDYYSEPIDNSNSSSKLVIKSKPFGLEEFAAEFPLPQIVRVYAGHYGITEQFSMSEGEELILFFIKSAKVVMASTQRKTETYHLPLNSSLQFGLYQVKSTEEGSSYHYETVEDLLNREEGLPKVVKVRKTFSGPSVEQSVMAGDLIFPQKVSGKKKNRVLKCKDKRGAKLKLALNCLGDFSTDPSDVRMFLLEYIEYVNEFPVTVLIFNDKEEYNSKLSCLRTGTVLILDAPIPLRSYICSTDIFGEREYPIIELPMIMPIQIQSMERPGLDMQPIYSKIQHAYENFDLSMVKKSMFPAQNERELKVQQQFYEEIKRDDGSSHLYDLERPEAIYEQIPGEVYSRANKEVKPPRPSLPSKPFSPQKAAPLPPSVQNPPLPPMNSPPLPPMNQTSPKSIEEKPFPPQLPNRPTNPPSVPTSPLANPNKAIPAKPPSDLSQGKPPSNLSQGKPPMKTNIAIKQLNTAIEKLTPEENKALLKDMSGEDVLQLLENMNLGEYKDSFQQEQVDGELMVELTKKDLEDLGVTKNIHQIRLMKLIDGSSSVKKYADGLYGTLS